MTSQLEGGAKGCRMGASGGGTSARELEVVTIVVDP